MDSLTIARILREVGFNQAQPGTPATCMAERDREYIPPNVCQGSRPSRRCRTSGAPVNASPYDLERTKLSCPEK